MEYKLIGDAKNTILVIDDSQNSYSIPVDPLNRDFRQYLAACKVDKKHKLPIDPGHYK